MDATSNRVARLKMGRVGTILAIMLNHAPTTADRGKVWLCRRCEAARRLRGPEGKAAMKLQAALILAFVGSIAYLTPESATAQAVYAPRTRGGMPPAVSRPTISPYLNLFRNDGGVVGNYYSLVRPMRQQQAFNAQQYQSVRGLERDVQRVDRAVQAGAQRPADIPATGHTSTFMNFSHFYNMPQQRR